MGERADILRFLDLARADPRLGPLHISVYLAIFYCWVEQGSAGPVAVTARDLVALAKVAAGTPLYRRMRDLQAFGYIKYEPSFNPAVKSRVVLICLRD